MPTTYRLEVHNLEVCNCDRGCGCQFKGFPDRGSCEAILGHEVIEGKFGSVDLTGARAVIVARWPGAIHEGGGEMALFVDAEAPEEQVEALATIYSGQAGGMPWEALAGTIDTMEGPVLAPIEMTVDDRRSSYRIPDVLDVRMTPLVDPVTATWTNQG